MHGSGGKSDSRLPSKDPKRPGQFCSFTPTRASKSTVGSMTMASHGQPSRNAPSGPLLVHFLHPLHNQGSTMMRPNGWKSGSGTQNMQSSIGQYSTHAGDPAQPVQPSVMTAISLGAFFGLSLRPTDFGRAFSGSTKGSTTVVAIDSLQYNGIVRHNQTGTLYSCTPSGGRVTGSGGPLGIRLSKMSRIQLSSSLIRARAL